ncbi:MAG: hypothetical protein M1840_002316 [Geoglossum simile]|nr:MAG: hypothetical protein M1840_002316 [Geoglossum simile]
MDFKQATRRDKQAWHKTCKPASATIFWNVYAQYDCLTYSLPRINRRTSRHAESKDYFPNHHRERSVSPSLPSWNATANDPPVHVPQSSYDTTLSAFAQLATLRLNTRRALISLIDQTNQYILAEATQTLSLQSDTVHNDQDELWFGCTTLSRSQGLCEKALGIRPSSKDGLRAKAQRLRPLIISDLSRDDAFKGHPFVISHLSLRFYAAIPISSKSDFNIGTLCVFDDKP